MKARPTYFASATALVTDLVVGLVGFTRDLIGGAAGGV